MVLDQISNMQAIFHAQIDFRFVKRKQSQYHGAGVIMTIALHFFFGGGNTMYILSGDRKW